MRNLQLQAIRKGFFTAFLSILLSFAVGFSLITVCAWRFAAGQVESVEEKYVTIAVLGDHGRHQHGNRFYIHEDGSIEWEDGRWYYPPHMIYNLVDGAPGLTSVTRHCLLSAHVPGMTALSSGARDILQYNASMDQFNYNLCVLAVRCADVEEYFDPAPNYRAELELIDAVSRLDAYELPPDNDIFRLEYTGLVNQDGSIPFEVGKTYLVRGFYKDYPIAELIDDEASKEKGKFVIIRKRVEPTDTFWSNYREFRFMPEDDPLYWVNPFYTSDFYSLDFYDVEGLFPGVGIPNFTLDDVRVSDNSVNPIRVGYCSVVPEGSLPFWAEYTGDWRDFLETPEGAVWRDEIIPMCELNHASAPVLLTDRAESLYQFNTGDVSILEGRSITPDEYAAGAEVCLVSAEYADLNGLAVGDSLHLDFYDPGYYVAEGTTYSVFSTSYGDVISRFPMQAGDRIGVEKDYEIVGIYTGPGFALGAQAIRPDTIFVPKASVPGAEAYEDPDTELLNSYILKNGSIDEFEAYMADQGMGKLFLYYDQGYEAAAASLAVLQDNALRLLAVSTAVFVLTAALYVYLRCRMIAPVVRRMRLLGVSAAQTRREMIETMALWTVVAVLVGAAAGAALYGTVTRNIFSEYAAIDWRFAAACAVVQLLLLTAVEFAAAWRLSRQNLMQRRDNGK